MEKITTEKQLVEKIEHCGSCLKDKFAGKDGKKHLVVCGGTGCISSHSDEILERLETLIKERHLEDIVTVNRVVASASALKVHSSKYSQKTDYIAQLK